MPISILLYVVYCIFKILLIIHDNLIYIHFDINFDMQTQYIYNF